MKFKGFSILLCLMATVVSAEEVATTVDFSKAYVKQNTTVPTEIRINGVAVRGQNVDLTQSILIGFNPSNASFSLLEAQIQPTEAELLEQRLRGTVWTGQYTTNVENGNERIKNIYLTELRFSAVQDGFIAGEIVHKSADPEAMNLLRATVVGDIVTEYLIDRNEKETIWIDDDSYQETIASIQKPEHYPMIKATRQLIRLKRMRALEFRHVSGSWGSNNEYRMVLEGKQLVGSVGTPSEKYSNKDITTGNGVIELSIREK